ncbi:MAG: hypothetical protein AB1451_04120 [Nitrospirota bacterium]
MSALKRKWILAALAGWLAAVVPLVASGAEIQLTVSVPHPDAEGGVATNRLRLGMTPSATNAFDPSLDLKAFPSPGLSAAVWHPEYATAQQSLWWDLREDAFPQVWEVEVSSDRPNASITISGAAPPTVPNDCSQGQWTLRDTETNQIFELGVSPLTYQYLNTAGVTRRFVVRADELSAMSPPEPQNLWSPRQGRASVYLAWSGTDDPSTRYHVYRETAQGTVRLTETSIATASFVDTGVDRTVPLTYRITAVAESGCESGYSTPFTLAPHR